jgi:protein-cysteine N-palmitoyltransferase HHAT
VHGFNTLKILVILVANYALARGLGGTKALGVATWGFNVGVLFLNEWYDGYRFGDIHDFVAPLVIPLPSTSCFLC